MSRLYRYFNIFRLGRMFRRSYPNYCLIFLIIFIFSLFVRGDRRLPNNRQTVSEGVYQVERVVDGDTLLLSNGIRVRLLGIDAPESVKPSSPVEPFGRESAEYAQQAISYCGNRVFIRLDNERFDKYHRLLAFVFLGDSDDSRVPLLNEELVRAGLARAQTQYNYSSAMKRRLINAQNEAKYYRRGIWSISENQTENPLLQNY